MFYILTRSSIYLSCRRGFRPFSPVLRNVSVMEKIFPSKTFIPLVDKKKHKLVYESNLIRICSGFLKSRYRNWQILILFTPIVYYITSFEVVVACISSGALQHVVIAYTSKYLKNFVGKVYVNKEGNLKEIVISSLDTAGNRIDRVHRLNDLIVNDFKTKYYQKFSVITISVENTGIQYAITSGMCKVYDAAAVNAIFGDYFVEWNKEK